MLQMDVRYINPFIESSQIVIKQMTSLDVELGKVYIKDSPYKSDNIMVIVGVTGKMRGQVALVMNLSTAKNIASKMMGGMKLDTLDEMGKSAISELTNMILGNTATILFNRGIAIEITPPSTLMGDNIEVSTGKRKTVRIPLLLGTAGEIIIDVSLE